MSIKTDSIRANRSELRQRALIVAGKIKQKRSAYFDRFIESYPHRIGQKDIVYSVFNGRLANKIITEELEAFYKEIKNIK
jgi:hypothetical protein